MTDSESSQSNGSEFEVEAIENDRITEYKDPKTRRTKNIREYLIKWVGYRRRSWEPEENLENCLQMLEQYKKNKKKLNKGIVKNNKNNSNTNTNNKKRLFECSETNGIDIKAKNSFKKKRIRKSNQQIGLLSQFYSENKNWTKKQIKEISEKTGLKENKIYKWLWDQKNKEFKATKFVVNK